MATWVCVSRASSPRVCLPASIANNALRPSSTALAFALSVMCFVSLMATGGEAPRGSLPGSVSWGCFADSWLGRSGEIGAEFWSWGCITSSAECAFREFGGGSLLGVSAGDGAWCGCSGALCGCGDAGSVGGDAGSVGGGVDAGCVGGDAWCGGGGGDAVRVCGDGLLGQDSSSGESCLA